MGAAELFFSLPQTARARELSSALNCAVWNLIRRVHTVCRDTSALTRAIDVACSELGEVSLLLSVVRPEYCSLYGCRAV